MSTEEIVHTRKDERLPGKKPASPLALPKKQPVQAPANPVGEQELSDEELEFIEGGATRSHTDQCDPTV